MLRKRKVIIVSIVVILVALLFYLGNGSLFAKDKVVEDIEEKDFNFTIDQLTSAVLENDIGLVNQIIESDSLDINEKDSQGQYPIEMVLVMGNCDMAKILLEAGADPYVITSNEKSVYDMVMEEDNESLKEIFSQYSK